MLLGNQKFLKAFEYVLKCSYSDLKCLRAFYGILKRHRMLEIMSDVLGSSKIF